MPEPAGRAGWSCRRNFGGAERPQRWPFAASGRQDSRQNRTRKVNRSSGKIQNGNPIRLKRVSRRFNLLRCLQLHCHVTITARALPHVIFGLNESRCHPIAALTRQGTWLENSYRCNGKALKKKKKKSSSSSPLSRVIAETKELHEQCHVPRLPWKVTEKLSCHVPFACWSRWERVCFVPMGVSHLNVGV